MIVFTINSPTHTEVITMQVPFLDLKAQYAQIKDQVQPALIDVMENTAFAGGSFVAEFEKNFADYCQCKHAIGVGSGTEALWVALVAMGVKPGDEVITAANTFIATAEAISFAGATPVFVDVEEHSYNLDPVQVEAAITDKTKVIIPVHLYGQIASMDPVLAIAKKHGLRVLEDASQSHGATSSERRAGSIADAGCFSFYPGKNLGAYGEAGAITTNDDELAATMRRFRDHGQAKKYYHDMVGWNARMDGFQGAVLDIKLNYLPEWTKARQAHAAQYNQLLAEHAGIQIPSVSAGNEHVYHIYAIRTQNRDQVMQALAEKGVASGIHYPIPLHLQTAYADLGYKQGQFPVAERCAAEQISLPMYAELTEAQIAYVAEQLKYIVA